MCRQSEKNPGFSNPTDALFVAESAAQLAAVLGLSERIIYTAKPLGMPFIQGAGQNDLYPIGPVVRWFRANRWGKNASDWQDPSEKENFVDEEVGGEKFQSEVREFLLSHNWLGAVLRVVSESTVGGIDFSGLCYDLAFSFDRNSDKREPPFAGNLAIRFAETSTYVWAGLSPEVAGAIVRLTNLGQLWLIPPSCLPKSDDWRIKFPARSKCTFENLGLSVAEQFKPMAKPGSIEAVPKPGFRVVEGKNP